MTCHNEPCFAAGRRFKYESSCEPLVFKRKTTYITYCTADVQQQNKVRYDTSFEIQIIKRNEQNQSLNKYSNCICILKCIFPYKYIYIFHFHFNIGI
jgi:hypothetical protein